MRVCFPAPKPFINLRVVGVFFVDVVVVVLLGVFGVVLKKIIIDKNNYDVFFLFVWLQLVPIAFTRPKKTFIFLTIVIIVMLA